MRALERQNPAGQSAMIENPATGEVIVDFVTWPADRAFVEFNVFKYARKPGGGSSPSNTPCGSTRTPPGS